MSAIFWTNRNPSPPLELTHACLQNFTEKKTVYTQRTDRTLPVQHISHHILTLPDPLTLRAVNCKRAPLHYAIRTSTCFLPNMRGETLPILSAKSCPLDQ